MYKYIKNRNDDSMDINNIDKIRNIKIKTRPRKAKTN